VHAECGGEGAQPSRDFGRQRPHHECDQQHDLHDAGAEDVVASRQSGRDRSARRWIDVVPGHRVEQRPDEELL
jgi:hypothetical protein